MASTWKINGTSTAALNVSNLKIKLCNHAEDVATWTCEGDGIADSARWAYGDTVDIKMGSTRVFQGVVTSIPREGTGEAERVSYEARGGWYWLGKCFYTQKWSVGESGARQSKTRVVLGGESPNTQIRDILSRAMSAGAPIAIGTVSVASVKPPADEQVDLTCANAIDRLLSWFPDTAVWFDYSGGGSPRINLRRRAALSSLTLPVAQAAESVSATPRHDLVVPGVEIVYEITSTKNDKTFRDVRLDSAGDAGALGAARFTIALDGAHQNNVWQSVRADRIWEADLEDPDWWVKRLPELKGWTGPNGTGKPVIHTDFKFPKADGSILNHELVSGSIAPWMRCASASAAIVCTASYSLGGETFQDVTLRANLTLTNAHTGVYSFCQSKQEAEAVPQGLAAQIHDAVKHLYWQGQIKYVGEDPPRLLSPGNRLNLSGGLSAWESMNSAIQTVELAADTGSTVISFGPPEHLGPQDLVQLAQANRKRRATTAQTTRNQPEISATEPVLGGQGPASSAAISGGRGGSQGTWAFEATATPDSGGSTYTVKVRGGTAQAVGGRTAVFPDLTATVSNGEYFYIRFSLWNNNFEPTCYWYNDSTGATGTIEHGQTLPTPSGNARFIVLVLCKVDSSIPGAIVQYRAGAIDIDATLAAGVAGSGITVRTISS